MHKKIAHYKLSLNKNLFIVNWIELYLLILTIYKLLESDLKCGGSDHFSVKCFNGFYGHVLNPIILYSISLDRF